jgi:hypothetical protein
MSDVPKMKSAFIAANIVKFGLPLGLIFALTRLAYFYFFSAQGITFEELGHSCAIFVFFLIWGAVLAFVRLKKTE